MRIWTITVGEPIPGFSGTSRQWRCGALSQVLADRGHDVTWWTSSVDHFSKTQMVPASVVHEVSDCLRIQFLRGPTYARNVSMARYWNHRVIAREFSRLAGGLAPPDLVLCSFPTIELSAAAVAFGVQRGIPVFLDIRDLWPDEILARVPLAMRGVGRLVLWPLFRDAAQALRAATGIIGISESYLHWALNRAGRSRTSADRVFPLGYTADLNRSEPRPEVGARLRALGVDPAKKILWFSGTFVGNIDLGTVIEAARALSGNRTIQFVFSGSGERDREWRRQAAGLGNVVFTGWVESEELLWLSRVAWAGLAAYRVGASMSLPNKLFEYMSMELPVLLSLKGEAKALVISEGLGAVYEAGSARSLVELVSRIVEDAEWRAQCASRARRLFEERYSLDTLYASYADFLEGQCPQHA